MINNIFSWFSKFKIHLLVWLVYMTYEALSLGIFFNDFRSPIIYLSHYAIVFLLFYLHADLVLPRAARNEKLAIWIAIVLVIVELALYVCTQYLVTLILVSVELTVSTGKKFDVNFVLRNVYRGILFTSFSTGYYFLRNYLKEKKRTSELEKERLEKIIHQQQIEKELMNAQNAFLKAQINPHFLFNTLDFVYHKVNAQSAIAGEAVIKLAEMMRFAIDSDEMGTLISLRNEIEQVENLLFLYQVRKTTDLNVHFTYSEEVKELRLIPLVILTLVENIFKHGDISNPDEIAYIDLELADGRLHIQTRNMIKKYKVEDSNHSGLNNIKKRLSYAYGKQVQFQYHTIGHHFKVDISIPVELLRQRI